jgi:hypothetical protein
MGQSKLTCAICGKAAIAFAVEKDGSRTGLCLNHIPTQEAEQPYGILIAGKTACEQPKSEPDAT